MIVHCKSGMRSAKAIQFLREQGFKKLINLRGGILAWADRIDPTMPKY
jgi:adenylyltransferase/sulfurtransferase